MSLRESFQELMSRFDGHDSGVNPPAKSSQFKFLNDLDGSFDLSEVKELYQIANGQSVTGCPLFSMNYFEDISKFEDSRRIKLMMAKNDLNDKIAKGKSHDEIVKGIEEFNCSLYWDKGWIVIGSSEYSSFQILIDVDKRRSSFGRVGIREHEDYPKGYVIANSLQHFLELTTALVDNNEMTEHGCFFTYPKLSCSDPES